MLLVSTSDSMNSFWPRRVKNDSRVAYSVTFRSTAVKLARLKSADGGGGADASSRRPVTAEGSVCHWKRRLRQSLENSGCLAVH